MEFNNKKLERTTKIINYSIAFILCVFLISLSNKIINDMDQWQDAPVIESYQDQAFLNTKNAEIRELNKKINVQEDKKRSIENTLKVISTNYNKTKKSFDNWLEARKTIGSPKEDKEILARANELDEIYQTEQAWRKELLAINQTIQGIRNETNKRLDLIQSKQKIAYDKLYKANKQYELNVFLLRLLFSLPILLLALFFALKFRKHKYWPLFLGFILFAVYVFFVGLVPFLPSYGGYVRYTVGISLSILLGIYAINKIKAFVERKKDELKAPTTERAKQVQIETAEKALDNHMCPSCGKDFIVKKWDKSIDTKTKETATYGYVTNFCRFCGLELFKKCKSCGCENYAHLPFCSSCGDHLGEDKK